MTKRHFSLIVLLLLPTLIWAGKIPEEVARQKAIQFMQQLHTEAQMSLRLSKRPQSAQQQQASDTPYYIYSQAEGQGFVIISGDDRTEPVLGYADEGSFDETMMPENMRLWLESIAQEMAQLDMFGIEEPLMAPSAAANHTAIAPMLTSKWGQGAPFNCELPLDPTTSEGVQTGCVATAMAQVMNYFRYPNRTTATIPLYTTESRNIEMPAIGQTNIDWNNMLPVYDSNATDTQCKAVGTLMKLCGQAVRMDYRSSSSGASTASSTAALIAYFGYDAGIRFITRSYYTAEEWDDIIYNELKNHRPVIYRGTRDRSGGDSSHAFVVDGYDGHGLYHLNWGWNGNYNGYFLLSVLSPYETSTSGLLYDNEGYVISQQAVIGIQPDAGGTPEPALLTSQGISIGGATKFTRSSASQNFSGIKLVSKFFNFTGATHSFDQGIGAWDKDGNLVACQATATNRQLDNNYGSRAFESTYAFGSGLPNGKYRIINISREHGNNTSWQPNINSEQWFIWAEINGNTLTLSPVTIDLTGTIATEGKVEAGALVKLHTTIHNSGTNFNNIVYLMVDGVRKGGRYVTVDEGETANVDMGFVPAEAGNHTLQLAVDGTDDYETFAQTVVSVAEASINQLQLGLVSANAVSGKEVGQTLKLVVSAQNIGNERYENRLRGMIYKLRDDGTNIGDLINRQDVDVDIAPGTTANAEFTFSPLDVGGRYFLYFYYYSNGTTDRDNRLYCGTYTVIQTATGVETLNMDATKPVEVYSLDGRCLHVCQEKQLSALLQQLPKAVYIINGKKVICY